ncbi:hypothetical protein, partial [Hymenobacter lucidus]
SAQGPFLMFLKKGQKKALPQTSIQARREAFFSELILPRITGVVSSCPSWRFRLGEPSSTGQVLGRSKPPTKGPQSESSGQAVSVGPWFVLGIGAYFFRVTPK